MASAAPSAVPLRPVWIWGPLIVWMGAIFALSSVPGSDLPGLLALPGADKVGHLVEYVGLGFLTARALARRSLDSTAAVTIAAAVFALAYGISDEIHQRFVPNREFDLVDLSVDTIGGVLGSMLWLWGLRRRGCPAWW